MLGLLSGTVRSAPNPMRKTLLCALTSETQADSGLRVTRQLYLVIQGLSRQVNSLDPFGNGWFEASIAPRLAIISPDRVHTRTVFHSRGEESKVGIYVTREVI